MSKRKIYGGIGILLILLLMAGYFWLGESPSPTTNIPTQKRCVAKTCFHVEIADSPEERTQGLMFREKLEQNGGMVFIFPTEDIHSFRMKNTKIPLDMIRLDTHFKVIDIQEATPCTQDPCHIYTPIHKASYVIELNQGTAKNLGLHSGDIFSPR